MYEVSAGTVPYPLLKTLQVGYRIRYSLGIGTRVFTNPGNPAIFPAPYPRVYRASKPGFTGLVFLPL